MGNSSKKQPDTSDNESITTIQNDMDLYSAPRAYPMTRNKRGLAVIWYITDFEGESCSLPGYETDKDNLKGVLNALSFKTIVEHNLKKTRAKKLLRRYAKIEANKAEYDAFVFCIMSHGNQFGFVTADEKTMTPEYVAGFFEKSRKLVRKPKMFFIQACRGNRDDAGARYARSAATMQSGSEGKPFVYKTALKADFLVVFATPTGFSTIVNHKTGSWFIQALVIVLKRYVREIGQEYKVPLSTALLDMARMVAEGMKRESRIKKSTKPIKQIPWMSSTLTARVYFPPFGETENLGDVMCSQCGQHKIDVEDTASDATGRDVPRNIPHDVPAVSAYTPYNDVAVGASRQDDAGSGEFPAQSVNHDNRA